VLPGTSPPQHAVNPIQWRIAAASYAVDVEKVPVVDIEPLRLGTDGAPRVAELLHAACREVGFFYVVGHGVAPELLERLDRLARQFFALPSSEKEEIAMARGGRAWRGWFPLGGELTSGVADEKEGLYFGTDLGPEDPHVRSGTPLHGLNLFPRHPGALRPAVLAYMQAMAGVGQSILRGLAPGLGLAPSWFEENLTASPLELFRIFRYPPLARTDDPRWSVGAHTDYGLLTILGQDSHGGLQVQRGGTWVDVPPLAGSFVCNLGDMLERVTGGLFRSTPHRVRHTGSGDRLSFPFFFDPSWDAVVHRLPVVPRPIDDDAGRRWDHLSVHGFEGTYGDYITAKVGRVFPALADRTGRAVAT
jgi:isopenicillin N synthase-like dioxygenase